MGNMIQSACDTMQPKITTDKGKTTLTPAHMHTTQVTRSLGRCRQVSQRVLAGVGRCHKKVLAGVSTKYGPVHVDQPLLQHSCQFQCEYGLWQNSRGWHYWAVDIRRALNFHHFDAYRPVPPVHSPPRTRTLVSQPWGSCHQMMAKEGGEGLCAGTLTQSFHYN